MYGLMTKEGVIFSSMCILGISTAFCGHPVLYWTAIFHIR